MSTPAGLAPAFPSQIPFPPLLAEFVVWAEHFGCGQLGWFSFSPQRLTDYWIENGTALAERFALFLHLPDSGMIGFWHPDGHTGPLPMVLLGSEGSQTVLGTSLEDFLLNWSEGTVGEAYDLAPPEEEEEDEDTLPDARPALKTWLLSKNVQARPASPPDLTAFFDLWQRRQLERWKEDEHLQAIGAVLRAHRKAKMKAWESVEIKADICGTRISVTGSDVTDTENLELIGRCVAVREEMASAYPERGLWFSARFNWYPSGTTTIRAQYMNLPENADHEAALADLRRMPRNAFWTPSWAS